MKIAGSLVSDQAATVASLYGLPTNVVTLWAASVVEKRAPVSETAVCATRLALFDVSHGVTWPGHEVPDTKSGSALTPADVHHGLIDLRVAERQAALDIAFASHPERFPHGPPIAQRPPREVWINKPQPAPGATAATGDAQRSISGAAAGVTGAPDTLPVP